LHLAVKRDFPDMVDRLLTHRADIDINDGKSGQTPLYMAADQNRLTIADMLLTRGANTQISSYSGLLAMQVSQASKLLWTAR